MKHLEKIGRYLCGAQEESKQVEELNDKIESLMKLHEELATEFAMYKIECAKIRLSGAEQQLGLMDLIDVLLKKRKRTIFDNELVEELDHGLISDEEMSIIDRLIEEDNSQEVYSDQEFGEGLPPDYVDDWDDPEVIESLQKEAEGRDDE